MSSMKCTIPGVNLKVFGRAIQSLSKIGDELYFEPLEDGLFLRTVNSCRSAYGYFQFSPSFFLHYIDGISVSGGEPDEESLRCKIGMKSIMTVFKSLSTIDRVVEKCRISLNMSDARLVFQLYCRHGIVKTHNLAFIECESLQAIFSKDLCPNKITTRPKLLCDAVLNFQASQEEITLILRPNFLALKNYVEDEPDKTKVIHTELTLDPDEFDQYQVGVDTSVTFCLKEFRAILAFVDITDLPICLHFESAGRPVTFTVCSDLSFEANFVLATLKDESPTQLTQRPVPQGQTSERKIQNKHQRTNGHTNRSNHKDSRSNTTASTSHADSAFSEGMNDEDDAELSRLMDITAPPDETILNNNETIPQPRSSQTCQSNTRHKSQHTAKKTITKNGLTNEHSTLQAETSQSRTSTSLHRSLFTKTRQLDKFPSSPVNDNDSYQPSESHQSTSHKDIQPSPAPSKLLSLRGEPSSSSEDVSPQIPLQTETDQREDHRDDLDASPQISLQGDTLNSRINTELSEEDSDDDQVPGTPPYKKFKTMLFGTQSSTQSSQSQRPVEVLAMDSDDES